jgi:hypothetical protein
MAQQGRGRTRAGEARTGTGAPEGQDGRGATPAGGVAAEVREAQEPGPAVEGGLGGGEGLPAAPAPYRGREPLSRRGRWALGAALLLLNLPVLHWALKGAPDAPVALPFRDDFSRASTLEAHYWTMGGGLWRVIDGALHSPAVRSNRMWLRAALPADAVVEFDARTDVAGADVRVEIFGNGRDGTARTDGSTQGTGYILVHGGARPSQVVLARLDEKAPARVPRDPASAWRTEGSGPALVPGRTYRWRIERQGRRLLWSIDGRQVLQMDDPAPLEGAGHDRFGFMSNQGDVYYDNLFAGAAKDAPAPRAAAPAAPAVPPLSAPFADTFDRAELGPQWNATAPEAVRLEGGELVLREALNRPVWLRAPLPERAALEFDAWTPSPEGDIKVELWGDGESFHAGDLRAQYTASGFVAVFGGWRNTASVLTRGNEHQEGQAQRRDVRVEPNRRYRWRIERQGGRLRWLLDGKPFLEMADPGEGGAGGTRHFGFSGWRSELHFDNLRIEPL